MQSAGDHIAHVGFVDAHAEGVGGHHDGLPVELKVVLVLPPLLLVQPRVVAGGGEAPLLQIGPHLLHPGAGGAVDDAAPVPPGLEEGEEGGALAPGGLHVEVQVGPVKAGDLPHRVLHGQQAEDVLLHLGGGGGGEGGHHRPPGQLRRKPGDLQIAGPEVLTPLGDAVGLVHRHQGDGRLPGQGEQPLSRQPLRGGVQQLVLPLPGPLVHQAQLLPGEGAVEKGGGHPGAGEGGHLVLHQGDQGGDHQGDPGQQQGGHLVAQGLAPAGGHHPQHVPAGQDGPDELLLPGAELVVAEAVL